MKFFGSVFPLGLFLRYTIVVSLFAIFLDACSPATVQPTPAFTWTEAAILTPYHTSTPTATLSPSLVRPTKTPLPPPTATPFTHTIKKDETLLGIAFRYGVELDDLLAANPGVNVHFLTIGTVLVIPLTGDLATPTPTIAPPLLQVSEPKCYIAPDSYLNCLAEITNPLEDAYEKLSLRFELFDQDETLISEQLVAPPLDRLPPGGALPVMASFSIQLPGDAVLEHYSVRLTLLSALAITPVEDQPLSSSSYLVPVIQESRVEINDGASSAQVNGKIAVPDGTSSLWLVSVAYDRSQKPVGLRRLEINDICPGQASTTPLPVTQAVPPEICAQLPFQLSVYSLGPAIERVELFAEAHR